MNGFNKEAMQTGSGPKMINKRSVSFEVEDDPPDTDIEKEHVPLQTTHPTTPETEENKSESEAEAEDVLAPLPSEKTPHIFERPGKFSTAGTLTYMRKVSTQTFTPINPKDENQDRGNWSNPIEFVLSILGYCIGLGNIWRFPVLAYKNGGGAFLIPYLIMLFGCGLPLILLELSLGQYSSEAILTVWKVSPMFKGLGIGMVLVNVITAIYYNMITGWGLYYFFLSLRAKLPWQCCEKPWRTDNCVSFDPKSCGENMTTYVRPTFGNGSKAAFAADEYFHNEVLKISEDIANIGGIHWQLAVALFVAWLIVFLVLCRGVKSLGKAAYFSSTFPFLILLTLLIRSAIEPGAVDGMKYFLTPRWELLKNAKIWSDAASQIFFTTGACCGGVITLASYNRFKNNMYPDACIVVFGNCIVSFFSGLVCFSILGFMAHSQGASIDDVITSGPGLTFIVYPQGSFTYYVGVIISMFPTVEILTSSMVDQFMKLRPYKYFVTMATCFVLFLGGLLLCTNGGMYILELMNTYGAGYSLLFLGVVEIAVICWRYGASRVMKNIKHMLDRQPCFLWKYMWLYVSPALLIFAIIFTCVMYSPSSYDDYVFPVWANLVGLAFMLVCLLPIPIYAVYKILIYGKSRHAAGRHLSLWQIIQELTLPTEEWGPALKVYKSPSQASAQKHRAITTA